MVSAKSLQKAVIDLQSTSPFPGILKIGILGFAVVTLIYLSWTATDLSSFIFFSFLTGIVYAPLLITTHDAIHHTLTGWKWFDEIVPRIIAYPILWLHGTYGEIHKIHHKMNGDDLNDPERVQWSVEEYAQASSLTKIYVKRQWFFDIFVLAGCGLILKTLLASSKFAKKSRSIRKQLFFDLFFIVTTNSVIYGIASYYGHTVKYFCFWLILERIGGGILQLRAHIEHYGLWGKGRHYFETQCFACRNIRTNFFVSWYFNHLNFHSVHHAFPRIPFYQLKTAHQRISQLYLDNLAQLPTANGYLFTSLNLARNPQLIGQTDANSAQGKRKMIPIKSIIISNV